jgi:hypothetical protein
MKTLKTFILPATLLIAGLTAGLFAGCSLYHSSDRDFFDNNGSAGAPVRAATLAKPTYTACEKIHGDVSPASLDGLDLSAQDETLRIERKAETSSVIVRIAHRTSSESATLCKFAFDEPITDQDLASTSQALVETSL